MPGSKPPGPTQLLDPLPIPSKQPKLPPAPKPEATPKARVPQQKLLNHYEAFLVPALVLLMLGMALAYALPGLPFSRPAIGLPLIALLVGLIIYASGQTQSRWKIRIALWTICLVAGSTYYHQFHFRPGTDDAGALAPLDRAEILGTVETLSGSHRAIVKVKSINGQPAGGRVLASLPDDEFSAPMDDVRAGTRVLMVGDLRQPFHSLIPGTFDQEKYLAGQQVTALLKRPERLVVFETSNEPHYLLQRVTDRLKTQIAVTFSRALPSPQAEILGGIVLGDKAIPVERDTRQAFIQTGLIHILAASGMNVGIIAGAMLWLLSRLRWNYRAKLMAAMAAVAFYCLLTGLPPSIQRAGAMLEIALILKLLNKSLSPPLLLCIAGSILLLLHPDHIGSIGFQFSLLTTFGLVTMVPPLQEKLGYYITRNLAGLILVPLVAQIWVWPLSVFYFNQFPIHALPLNLLAIALVTPLTLIGFAAAALSIILPPVGGWLSWLAMPFLNGMLGLVQWGDSLAWAKWTLPSPSPLMLVLLYAQLTVILGLMLRLKQTPLSRKIVLGLLPLLAMLGILCAQKSASLNETQISLLPLSFKHEGYLIKPAGQNRYVALLPADLSYFESRAVGDYLKHRNITALETLILLPESMRDREIAKPAAVTLLRSLKQVRAQSIVTTPDVALSLAAPSPAHGNVVPLENARLELGGVLIQLQLAAQTPQVQVLSNRQCLLEVAAHPLSNNHCALQIASDNQEPFRLYPQALKTQQYHELRHRAGRMTVYGDTH